MKTLESGDEAASLDKKETKEKIFVDVGKEDMQLLGGEYWRHHREMLLIHCGNH